MSAKGWLLAVGLLILAGCTFPVRQQVDSLICDRSKFGFDLPTLAEATPDKVAPNPIEPMKVTTFEQRLAVPETVPGAEAPLVFLPKKGTEKERLDALIKQFFPPNTKIQPDPDFPPGPNGQPLTLSDLQQIAVANSPVLKQVASDIEAARGAAIQTGLYPNPTIGYTGSSAGPSGGPTFGVVMGQTIKVAGKLKLMQAMALMDLQNAEIAYRKAESDLSVAVRASYYAVLVAQENIRANRGLVQLTDEVYNVMVDQLKSGNIAGYEPFQLKVFSAQARTALVTARNSRLLAWKQLASTLGVPHMPPTALAGNIHRPLPRLDYEKALVQVLSKHTDVLTTAATIEKARYNLRLAQVAPYPDVSVQGSVQTDATPPGPSRVISLLQVSVPVPIFDRNQGGIRQAQAALVRANEEPHRVQADLTSRFSEAYRRYEENRLLLEIYRKDILQQQVQAFRHAVKRHAGEGPEKVAYNDLVSSEQNLVTIIASYMVVLQAQYQALADVSGFLQTNQLYQMVDEVNAAPTVNLDELLKLPCHHPCSPPVPGCEGFAQPPARELVIRLDAPLPAAPTHLPDLSASVPAPVAREPVPQAPVAREPVPQAPVAMPRGARFGSAQYPFTNSD